MDERVACVENPRSLGKALSGPQGELWRYRVGNCRVIYDIQDDALRVLVGKVSARDRVYWWKGPGSHNSQSTLR